MMITENLPTNETTKIDVFKIAVANFRLQSVSQSVQSNDSFYIHAQQDDKINGKINIMAFYTKFNRVNKCLIQNDQHS